MEEYDFSLWAFKSVWTCLASLVVCSACFVKIHYRDEDRWSLGHQIFSIGTIASFLGFLASSVSYILFVWPHSYDAIVRFAGLR